MRIQNILLFILVLVLLSTKLYSQNSGKENQSVRFDDFSMEDQKKIQERWDRFQPIVDLFLLSGDTISGQLIYANDEEIVIFSGNELIVGHFVKEDLIYVSMDNIFKIQFQKGGYSGSGLISGAIVGGGSGVLGGLILAQGWTIIPPIVLGAVGISGGAWLGSKIQKSGSSVTLDMHHPEDSFSKKYAEFQSSAVFTDSLFYSDDFNEVINSSKSLRRSFPDKHLRISFGLSAGPNTLKNNLEEMLESTSLPALTEYRPGPFSLDFFDFSWRFSDRYIVGGNMFLNLDSYTYLYHSNYEVMESIYYNYDIQLYGGKIYVDYALKPVNRYFAKSYELLLGGGLIFTSPTTDFTYGYVPDEATGDMEFLEFREDHSIKGIQLRSAFHYYPFPGLSLSAGLEANLIERLSIPAMRLPTQTTGIYFDIPEHKLNFSTVRIKIGASVYF